MTTLTTTELAEEIGTTPRNLRKFLRADARNRDEADTLPGKGSRYSIERKAVKGLKTRYTKWTAEEAAKRAAIAQKSADDAKVAADQEVDNTDEVPETDNSLDDLEGPSEDELLDLDN